MGQMYKRYNNWWIDYMYNGRRIRESAGTSNKILAQKMLAERETAILERQHDIKKNKKIPFQDFASEFYERHSRINKRSFDRDRQVIDLHLVPFFKDYYLYQIDSLMIEDYKAKRLREGAEKATVNLDLALLKTIFNKAIIWGKTKDNPVRKVKLFKLNNQRIRYLEKGEIRMLLDACDEFLRPLVFVALNTGMREGEIFNLIWDDINFDRGIIGIRYSKSGEPRYIPIRTDLMKEFERLKKNRNLDSSHIFCNNNKPIVRTGKFRYRFNKVIRDLKIRDFRFHDLRHTFASHWIMSGGSLMGLQKILGHKTLAMTLRYAHLSRDFMRSEIELISMPNVTILSQVGEKSGKSESGECAKIPNISSLSRKTSL